MNEADPEKPGRENMQPCLKGVSFDDPVVSVRQPSASAASRNSPLPVSALPSLEQQADAAATVRVRTAIFPLAWLLSLLLIGIWAAGKQAGAARASVVASLANAAARAPGIDLAATTDLIDALRDAGDPSAERIACRPLLEKISYKSIENNPRAANTALVVLNLWTTGSITADEFKPIASKLAAALSDPTDKRTPDNTASQLLEVARAAERLKELELSAALYEKTILYQNEQPLCKLTALCECEAAQVYDSMKDFERAYDHIERACQIAEHHGSPRFNARCFAFKGIILTEQDRLGEAEPALKKGLKMLQDTMDGNDPLIESTANILKYCQARRGTAPAD